MSEPSFSIAAEDDLPRTIRREREAREREAREREAREREARQREMLPTLVRHDEVVALAAPAATVTGFDVPFLHLMAFCVKAVFAAIPALVLLALLLWGFGKALASLPRLVAL